MTHCIRRTIVEVALPEGARADDLPRRAARVFQEKVLPRLDELFSRLASDDRIVRIERLDLDLGVLDPERWESDFANVCLQHIEHSLQTPSAPDAPPAEAESVRTLDPATDAAETLLHFLQMGTLPWHATGRRLRALESLLNEAEVLPSETPQRIASLLRQKPAALHRFVWQFSDAFVQRVMEQILRLPPGWMGQTLTEMQRLPKSAFTVSPTGRAALASAPLLHLCQCLLTPPLTEIAALSPPEAARQLAALTPPQRPHAEGSAAHRKRDQAPTLKEAPIQESRVQRAAEAPPTLPVENAGVVLLAPYLPAFFGALNLIESPTFRSEDDQYRAAHLIHYLATGQQGADEPALLLPKILCGLSIDEPVPADLPLTEAEKAECLDLLCAAIGHWNALKNTSPDGLRQGFLQRPGSLNAQPNADQTRLLRVERRGQDLLLARLPWSFSVVRLPWMAEALRVEW